MRRSDARLAAALALALSAPVAARAQAAPAVPTDGVGTDSTPVAELAPITVTAERPPQAVAPPVATVDITREELHRAPAATSYDLVRRTAGIEVHEQGQGPGYASDAVIRGFTSDHSSDVLLVVDGVPINLPVHGHVEGYADWSVLTPAAVGALRVIHGPASPLYGNFAFGGVVEAVTEVDAAGTRGALEGTSDADVGGWLRTGRRGEAGGSFLALSGRRNQGWRQNADYWLGNGVLRGWRRIGRGRLEGGLTAYASTWNSPGFVSVDRYNAEELERATDSTDGGTAGRLILQGRYLLPLGPALSLEVLGWGQGVRSELFLNIPEDDRVEQSEERDDRLAVGGQARVSYQIGAGEISAGLDGRADWARYELYRTEARARSAELQDDDGRYQSGGAFARWRGLLGERVVYDLGGRLDVLHYAGRDRLGDGAGWRSATHVVASPKLGLRYLLGHQVALLGSLSRGFRGSVGVIGDPSRAPVTTWAKEIGAVYDDGRLHAHLSLFHLSVSNERIFDPITRAVSDAGASVRRGASLAASLRVAEGVRLAAEATVNDAEITGVERHSHATAVLPSAARPQGIVPPRPSFHEVPLSPGDRVPGVAAYLGRVGVEGELSPTISSRLLFRFSGPYPPVGEPEIRTRAYGLVDLGASLRLREDGPVLDLDLLNALDSRYPELRASGYINPGSPRTLRVALRFEGRS